MTKRTRPPRKFLLAGAVATMMTIAACAPDSTGSNGSAATSGGESTHTSHETSSAAPALPLRAGERFVNLTMPEPYTPTAPNGGTDEYRCFLVDPKLTTPAYLTGSQFLPQNAPIVHHAIFFRSHRSTRQRPAPRTPTTPGEGWTCFGDAGIEGEQPSAGSPPGPPAPTRRCSSRTSATRCRPAACW